MHDACTRVAKPCAHTTSVDHYSGRYPSVSPSPTVEAALVRYCSRSTLPLRGVFSSDWTAFSNFDITIVRFRRILTSTSSTTLQPQNGWLLMRGSCPDTHKTRSAAHRMQFNRATFSVCRNLSNVVARVRISLLHLHCSSEQQRTLTRNDSSTGAWETVRKPRATASHGIVLSRFLIVVDACCLDIVFVVQCGGI